jgi:hypothetical protein
MRFYTVEKLGPKQSLTPEGFLLCEDVPLARTGEMLYGPGEIPVSTGPDGAIHIRRDESEVFRPEYLASLNGKPVVNDHPDEEVTPANWRRYAVGTTLHPRRGMGEQSDLVVGELLIYDPLTIVDVRAGKREVSCGYDADYEELGQGLGRQYNLIGNHVALVDSGRCGPRCAIGDRKKTGDCAMATKTRDSKTKDKGWMDKIKDAFKTKDESALDAALVEAAATNDQGEALHLHLGGQGGDSYDELEQRVGSLEGGMKTISDTLAEINGKLGTKDADDPDEEEKKEKQTDAEAEKELEEEAPAGAKDAARLAKDSALLGDSFQETLSLAEVLAPGIRVPTFDRAASPKKTFDAICSLRRNALDLAYAQPDGRGMVEEILGSGRTLDLKSMSCRDVRTLFRSVAGLKKSANRDATHGRETALVQSGGGLGVKGKIKTPADFNAKMREKYGS